MSDLGDRMKEVRRERGLTSSALARPRYSVSYVSQIERGHRSPSAEALRYFARRLGVSTAYLQTGIPDDLFGRLNYAIEQAEQEIAQDRPADAVERMRAVIREAEQVIARASAPPGQFGLGPLRGTALCVLGEALAQAGRLQEAIDAYESAQESHLTPTDRVRAVAGLAKAYRSVGDLSYAADLLEGFIRSHLDPTLDSAAVAELEAIRVSIYFERGDMTAAERAAQRALDALNEDTPPRTQAETWWTVSRVSAERGRWDEALDFARRARVIMEGLHNRRGQANLHTAYAFLCLEAEPPRIEEARAHLDAGEALLDPLRDRASRADLAFVYTERARIAAFAGRYEEAAEQAGRSAGIEEAEDLERARALFVQGQALGHLGRSKAARAVLQQAAGIFEKQGARRQLSSCWREVGRLHESEGNLVGAVGAYHAALDAFESVGRL